MKKIFENGENRIAILFAVDPAVKEQVRKTGAIWSNSLACWHVSYNKEKYNELKSIFPQLTIVKEPSPANPQAESLRIDKLTEIPPAYSPPALPDKKGGIKGVANKPSFGAWEGNYQCCPILANIGYSLYRKSSKFVMVCYQLRGFSGVKKKSPFLYSGTSLLRKK